MKTKMLFWVAVACVACGSEDPAEPAYYAKADAGPEVEAEAACPSVTGAVSCSDVIDAWCTRYVTCCDNAYDHGCEAVYEYNGTFAESMTKCRAAYYQNDCVHRTGEVCTDSVAECQQDILQVACEDLREGMGYQPASCAGPIGG